MILYTSSETQEQYHRHKSQRKFNCMHTCCAYNMQLQLHIHNVSRHYNYRGRDGTDARRTQYIFKASKLAIITIYIAGYTPVQLHYRQLLFHSLLV